MLGILVGLWMGIAQLAGEVRHAVTGVPVPGVAVFIPGAADTVYTDSAGRFVLPGSSRARVRFEKAGFVARDVEVADGVNATVALTPVPRALEATTVVAVRGEAESARSETTMSLAELERRSFGQELPLLLTAAPSITAYSDAGSYSGYSYLRLRGIDQTRINVTLDGIPLNDPEDHFLYYSNFPDLTSSLESVQLQRGVGTSSNGTAAFAGALHLESTSLTGDARGGEVQVGAGSFDARRASVEYRTGLLPSRIALYARGSWQDTDGYRHNAGNRSWSFFTSGGWFGDRDAVKVVAFGGRARNGLAYLATAESDIETDPRTNYLTPEERDDFFQGFGSVQWSRQVASGVTTGVTGYGMWAGGDYDVRFGDALSNYNLHSRSGGLIATTAVRRGALALDAGVHANRYARDHFLHQRPDLDTRLYDNTGHKEERSAFARAAWALGDVTLSGDLQVRRAAFRYDPSVNAGIPQQSTHWSFVNPKIGVTWQAHPALALFASYGRNGREPTRNDMFAGYDDLDTASLAVVGSIDRVRPESVRDLEAGVAWRGRGSELRANVFLMDFRDEITPIGPLSPIGLPLRKNVDRSWRRGVELEGEVGVGDRVTLSLDAAYTRSRIDVFTDDASGNTYHDVDAILTPRWVANPGVRVRLPAALTLSLDGRWLGESYLSNTGDRAFMTPGRFALDAGLGWQWQRTSLALQVNNATDERVYTGGYTDGASSYYYLIPSRNVFLTARVAF